MHATVAFCGCKLHLRPDVFSVYTLTTASGKAQHIASSRLTDVSTTTSTAVALVLLTTQASFFRLIGPQTPRTSDEIALYNPIFIKILHEMAATEHRGVSAGECIGVIWTRGMDWESNKHSSLSCLSVVDKCPPYNRGDLCCRSGCNDTAI